MLTLLQQPYRLPYCYPTSVANALRTMGDDVSLEELVVEMKTTKRGTKSTHVVASLLNRGYGVAWYVGGLHQWNFPGNISSYDQDALYAYLHRRFPVMFPETVRNAFIIPRAVNVWEMAEAHRCRAQVVVGLASNVLNNQKRRKITGHAVLVSKVEQRKRRVLINDPAYGHRFLSYERFIEAQMARIYSSALIIKRGQAK